MKSRSVWLGLAVMTALLGIALMGCATGGSGSATPSQSDLLSQAGFNLYKANSPERVAAVHTLPAKKVVSNKYKGKELYLVCTTPNSNQCYLGDRAAYDRYKQLAIQNAISEDYHKISEQRSDPEWWQMYMDSQGGG
jgi:hypothetical protein